MKLTAKSLIEDLIERTKDVINEAERYNQLPIEELNWKPTAEKWSVLECLEHLNRYGDFYIPEIENRIRNASKITGETTFKSGVLGNYFSNSMLPKEKLNKMNTFKSMNPVGSDLNISTLQKFIRQQKQILDLLNQARQVDLTKTKTAISISKWIKLRLGDTFRVVIYHNQRHIVQANKVLKQMKELV